MNSFNQYLINKIDVMEGIDFKANKKRQLMKDEIKRKKIKENRIHNVMMISMISLVIIVSMMLLLTTQKESNDRVAECMKYHTERYCLKNN